MGGFFGISSRRECLSDVFFGTDYHSHLGTRRGGLAVYDSELGLQREIHNISNSPFRTKFERVFEEMRGTSAIGAISDSDPQPLLIRSKLGTYAIATIGIINNVNQILDEYFSHTTGHFNAMTGGVVNSTELVAALINQKDSFADGIAYAQSLIDGTASILILTADGKIITARDGKGRIPVLIGSNDDGYCVSFEDFAYKKLGYSDLRELGPGEIVEITADGVTVLSEPGKEMKICAFLWSYYGYPTSTYEGVNVEVMRCRNGEIMADNDKASGFESDLDYVVGVPDSGIPHAIGYANKSGIPFKRPYIKYTPTWSRSFMPISQEEREHVAKMKLLPNKAILSGKRAVFCDDSIVRGTQLRDNVKMLYEYGAKEVHIRISCPPLVCSCNYLNFTASKNEMELITRRVIKELEGDSAKNLDKYMDETSKEYANMVEVLRKHLGVDSLKFNTLPTIVKAIGLPKEKICTHCFDGTSWGE